MNYTSKFDGLSSEFLLILYNMKDKAKKYPALNKDLEDLQVFYDATTNLFAQADADAIDAKVRLILLSCEKEETEKIISDLLMSLVAMDPKHIDKLLV